MIGDAFATQTSATGGFGGELVDALLEGRGVAPSEGAKQPVKVKITEAPDATAPREK